MKIVARLRERFRPWYLRRVYFLLHPARKPAYFNSCWSFPDYNPDAEPPTAPGLPLVVFLPMNDWHTRIQRSQHLARTLSARGYRCLYVNPHLGREFPSARRSGDAERLKRLDRDLFELHVHLPREPVFHHRPLLADEVDLVAGAVSRAIQRLEAGQVVQLVAFPLWLGVASAVRDRFRAPIVYDCHDYLPGFAGVASSIAQLEPKLFRSSDCVLCSSRSLLARAGEFVRTDTPRVLLRNAAANQFFHAPRAPTGTSPIIGYAGALDAWFDVASVEYAARAHPEWRFELIGRVENPRIHGLHALPNIHLAGEIPFDELPALVSTFSVGIIPFLLDPLIEATDPIKAYEYLAAGLPVVSSRLPEIERFGDLISRYSGPADFAAKLETALSSDSEGLVARRTQAATEETWERRGEELSLLIQSLL